MIKCLEDNLIEKMKEEIKQDLIGREYTTLNLGPTHPATHGIFQNVLKMDGEIIIESTPDRKSVV